MSGPRIILMLFFISTAVWAEETAPPVSDATAPPPPVVEPSVYVKKVKGEFAATYKTVFTALENNGYYVVFEPNIGRTLSKPKKQLRADGCIPVIWPAWMKMGIFI